VQVPSPSVTLPTPPLPPPLVEKPSTPEASQTPEAKPTPPPKPEFNPPTAQELNAPGSQTPGNPQFAPASVGMPSVTLNDADPGTPGSAKGGPGLLAGMFDWANKLRFNAAVRGGYDNNINTSHNNAEGSWFGNLNGAVNYRFGTPRLNFDATLTGGLTYYPQAAITTKTQGVVGLGMSVEYRHSPRLILTFNTSSSFQQQPNLSLIGTANQNPNQDSSYFYTANSFAANYQWSDILTTVTRLSYTANYYLNNSLNSQQGAFGEPEFAQSFRWLMKPTTTAVLDYDSNYYGYAQAGNKSWGNTMSGGFDHIFNPKMFWNWRLGAEFRTYQNSNGDGTYIGPYADNTFTWNFSNASKLSWLSHLATQPSGQQNVSYTPSFRSGLNYTQGITAKLSADMGLFYLIQYYKNSPYGPNGANINYYQNNVQGNITLNYALNRILQLSLGYQYISTICDAVPSQAYNRGISYLQLGGTF
jgi:hypothetical protein